MAITDELCSPTQEGFLALPQVIAVCGMGHSWIYAKLKEGKFPRPVKLGRSSRWRRSEITTWLNNPTSWRAAGTKDNSNEGVL
jgi:predicted DNA-binding transcriptional regulator AlpA